MMISMLRFGTAGVMGSLVFLVGPAIWAQQKPPIPSFTGERVIVAGVPDQYSALAGQITRLEKASPQSYYVVVVKSTGRGRSATREFADELVEDWRKQGPRRGRSFDPERSVIVVVAVDNKQVAVTPGIFLSKKLGLNSSRIDDDLIPVFIPLAREQVSRGDRCAFGRDQQLDRGARQRNALCRGSGLGREFARCVVEDCAEDSDRTGRFAKELQSRARGP